MTRDRWSEEEILAARISRILCASSIEEWKNDVAKMKGNIKSDRDYYLVEDLRWAIKLAKRLIQLSKIDPLDLPIDGELRKAAKRIRDAELEAEADDWYHR